MFISGPDRYRDHIQSNHVQITKIYKSGSIYSVIGKHRDWVPHNPPGRPAMREPVLTGGEVGGDGAAH